MNIQIFAVFGLLVVLAIPAYLGYAAPSVAVAAPTGILATGTNSREIYRAQDGFGNYASGYAISDALTGDHKVFHEQNISGAVIGVHSQLDPNGYERRTDYVADAFGTQVITDSENGLYVNAKDHVIRPPGAVVVAAVPAVAAHYAFPYAHHYKHLLQTILIYC